MLNQLNKKLFDLIRNREILKVEEFKNKLQKIYIQYLEVVQILMSNEKILSSLVCDVLDLTKLKSGKFKKNS